VIEPRFGKVGERVGGQVEDGQRLVGVLAVLRVGSIAAVQENDKPAVGRGCGGGGQVVDGARSAGDFAEQARVGKLSRCLRRGRVQGKRESAAEKRDEAKLQIGHAGNCSGFASKSGKCDSARTERGEEPGMAARKVMRKKRKLEKASE